MSTQGQGDVVGPPNTRFVSKPVEIEAHRIGIDPWPDAAWEAVTRNEIRLYDCAKPDGYIIVRTLEGEMRGNHGDWLIRGTEGEFYPCKPSVFERKYEARTLLSSSRGEQGPLAIALRTLSLIAEGHEKRMPDGTTEVWDVEDAAEVAKSAIAAVQSLTAAPSAPGSVPTSLAGQVPDDWTLVPNIGAYVEADHPITSLNPTKAFEVRHVECRSGSWYVRGENTCWFNVKGVKPATQENAVAAEEAAALQSSPQPTAGGDAPTSAAKQVPDGYVLVPREPTEEMLRSISAACRNFYDEGGPYPRSKAVYKAMLSAAPQPAAAQHHILSGAHFRSMKAGDAE